jgi:hypothetical protein
MVKKKFISIAILSTIVLGALFASQTLATGMQGQHEMMGQAEMDMSCAVHCFIAATDDGFVGTMMIVSVIIAFVVMLFSASLEAPRFHRLVPVRIPYRDPGRILTIQKRE